MKTAKTLVAAGIASAMIQLTACNHSGGCQDNPLLQESELPFGAPDFSKIKTEHYLPAIEAGIAQQREIIENIVKNEEAPTFENTILAFEESDVLLNRVKLYDTDKCIVNMPRNKVVVIQGLEDYIVVENNHMLLICKKSEEQQIRQYVTDVEVDFGKEFV